MALLEIKNLHATVGDREILKGIDLTINAGEVHAIMGPNGSGKSTLAGVLAGRESYNVTEGQILFDGKDLLEMAPEGNLKVEIRVSDTDIQKIWEPKPDGRKQAGQIATNSDPRDRYDVEIDRVVPLPRQEKGVNFFPVYATLKAPPADWKAGMEGEARIDVEHKPLIYIWTHRLADFVRLKLWM
jgi:energy-coupling factor transporter ATP-binding protein EcfA2